MKALVTNRKTRENNTFYVQFCYSLAKFKWRNIIKQIFIVNILLLFSAMCNAQPCEGTAPLRDVSNSLPQSETIARTGSKIQNAL